MSVEFSAADGEIHSECFELSNEVSSEIETKVHPTKLSIHMNKHDPLIQWKSLEHQASSLDSPSLAYPSSSKHPKNWSKMEDQMKNEPIQDGGQSVDAFFQELYKNASEETKRAMNKSFVLTGLIDFI